MNAVSDEARPPNATNYSVSGLATDGRLCSPTLTPASGRPHPLDELLSRAALEQCVSHTVDALGAG